MPDADEPVAEAQVVQPETTTTTTAESPGDSQARPGDGSTQVDTGAPAATVRAAPSTPEPVVTEPLVTEPLVTEPLVTEPATVERRAAFAPPTAERLVRAESPERFVREAPTRRAPEPTVDAKPAVDDQPSADQGAQLDPSAEIDTDGDGLTDAEEAQHQTDPHSADTDRDGLSDYDEVNVHGTDPNDAMTDGDDILDGAEVHLGTDPLDADSDDDGLSDDQEVFDFGTDPNNPDTDGDGLSDATEVYETGTDPLLRDTDGDLVSDRLEVEIGTDAGDYDPWSAEARARTDALADAAFDGYDDQAAYEGRTTSRDEPTPSDKDRDGLSDADEVALGTDPTDMDSDGDGVSDGAEVSVYGTDPLTPDHQPEQPGVVDSDRDGLSDEEELALGTDPFDEDSDDDALYDGGEVNEYGTDPLDEDSDDDGLSDESEVALGTDPWNADTDGDGISDRDELEELGTDPLDADTDGDGVSDGAELAMTGSADAPLDPTVGGQAPATIDVRAGLVDFEAVSTRDRSVIDAVVRRFVTADDNTVDESPEAVEAVDPFATRIAPTDADPRLVTRAASTTDPFRSRIVRTEVDPVDETAEPSTESGRGSDIGTRPIAGDASDPLTELGGAVEDGAARIVGDTIDSLSDGLRLDEAAAAGRVILGDVHDTTDAAAQTAGDIADDPIGFTGNLVGAVGTGIEQFGDNVTTHLRDGVGEWVEGAADDLPEGTVPDDFSLSGLTQSGMVVLGTTAGAVSERFEDATGVDVDGTVDQVVDDAAQAADDAQDALDADDDGDVDLDDVGKVIGDAADAIGDFFGL